jgi:hypothetical protein
MTKESEDKKEQRVREGAQAWADYQAEGRALRPSNDARLRNPTTTSALIRAGTGGTNPQSGECPAQQKSSTTSTPKPICATCSAASPTIRSIASASCSPGTSGSVHPLAPQRDLIRRSQAGKAVAVRRRLTMRIGFRYQRSHGQEHSTVRGWHRKRGRSRCLVVMRRRSSNWARTLSTKRRDLRAVLKNSR